MIGKCLDMITSCWRRDCFLLTMLVGVTDIQGKSKHQFHAHARFDATRVGYELQLLTTKNSLESTYAAMTSTFLPFTDFHCMNEAPMALKHDKATTSVHVYVSASL